jgi:mannan endo-1,4-beta-mannosidase
MPKRYFALICFLGLLSGSRVKADDMVFVERKGPRLEVSGRPVALLGTNRYDLAGGPQAGQCQHWGGEDAWWSWASTLIKQARATGSNTIRLWAFQAFAGPSGRDFSHLDKVIQFAKSKGVRTWLTLENNWGDCTQGGIKDERWYGGGYKARYGYALSFVDYIKVIVDHYKDEPAVAVWEIMNEAKLYETPGVLKQFLKETAGLIRSIDQRHLIAGGAAIQCWQGDQGAADFQSFQDDSNLQVVTAHDYDEDAVAWTGCMQRALMGARHFDKPFVIGEVGIHASAFSEVERADMYSSKIKAAQAKRVSGYLLWSINTKGEPFGDGFDFNQDGPTGKVLASRYNAWLPPY